MPGRPSTPTTSSGARPPTSRRTRRPSSRPPAGVLANGKDPYFAPWPDVVQLNAFSPGLREAVDRDADLDRRGVRRRSLRHGDADDQRGLRAHVGRARRRRAGRGLLAHDHRRGPRGGTVARLHRRGLLGHGVDAAAAGLRPLLRQASLRPPRRAARPSAVRGPPAGGVRLPGSSPALHREPRRAARCRHVRAGPGARRCRRDVDARRAPACTTPASSRDSTPTSPCSSPAAPSSRSTTSCSRSTRGSSPRSPTRAFTTEPGSSARARAGPTTTPPSTCSLGAGATNDMRRLVVVNLADEDARRASDPLGRPRGTRPGACATCSTTACSSATATSCRRAACTSRCGRGSPASSRSRVVRAHFSMSAAWLGWLERAGRSAGPPSRPDA